MSLREPLGQALDVVSKLTDVLALKKPENGSDYESFLNKSFWSPKRFALVAGILKGISLLLHSL